MKHVPHALVLATLLLAAVAPAHATWSHDPVLGNNPVCISSGMQNAMAMVPDGSGGTLYAWQDWRGASIDIYVQRLDAQGNQHWGATGSAAVNAIESQVNPVIVSDGAGGMILAWEDSRNWQVSGTDILAMRIDSTGAGLWTVSICNAVESQRNLVATTDGAGGAILAWEDRRSGIDDIYAQRVKRDGTRVWGGNGMPVCTAAQFQNVPQIASDGTGGAWIAWTDTRLANDIYVQHLDGQGTARFDVDGRALTYGGSAGDIKVAPDGGGGLFLCWVDYVGDGTSSGLMAQHLTQSGDMWANWGGMQLATGMGVQFPKAIGSDEQGGVFVFWSDDRAGWPDLDLYGQHLTFEMVPTWGGTGVALTDGAGRETEPALLADGMGGVFLAWNDVAANASYSDVYAQHVGSDGARQWAARGIAVSRAATEQFAPRLVADGAGGFIAAWSDRRTTSNADDLYAQRVDSYGMLGVAGPSALSVRDASNDQGGSVKVSWARSYLDALPTFGIADYRVWRSVPQARAVALAARRGSTRDPDDAFTSGRMFVRGFGAQEYAWEPVGSVAAAGLGSYSLVVATTCDSLPGSNPFTVFMVEARGGALVSSPHWFSAPDSGYSVDNIGPVPPAPLSGQYAAGNTSLHWQPNREADLAGYRLYRGSTAGFAADANACVATLADTGYVDHGGALAYYKLTAVDRHGNESAPAALSPSGTLGVGTETFATQVELSRPQPNPASTSTTFSFALPAPGQAQLAVYDAAGRKVRGLFAGTVGSGARVVVWDLLDSDGHGVPAGLYFARLTTPMGARIRRIVVTE